MTGANGLLSGRLGDHRGPPAGLRSGATMKFDLAPAMYQRLSVGDLVEVNWSPRRCCLNDITPAPTD
jgi:hypothetical protein